MLRWHQFHLVNFFHCLWNGKRGRWRRMCTNRRCWPVDMVKWEKATQPNHFNSLLSVVYGVAGLVIACMAICVIGIALRTTYVSARNEVLPQREKQSPIPGLLGGLFSYILLSCCGCFLFAWLFGMPEKKKQYSFLILAFHNTVGVALLVQSQDDEPCKAKYADFRQFITVIANLNILFLNLPLQITLIIIGVCTVLNCIQSCCRRARKKDDE